MKKVSVKQGKRTEIWAKVSKIRDDLLISKYGFLVDEFTGKKLKGSVEHHHNNRDRSDNTLENCRTVSSLSHRYITDENVQDVPDRLGLQPRKREPVDQEESRIAALTGHYPNGVRAISVDMQIGRRIGQASKASVDNLKAKSMAIVDVL